MKLVLKLLLLLLFVTGCKTKHLQIEKSEERQKEVRKIEKDSIFEQKKAIKTAVFQVDNLQSVELELITDKDSVGNSKELHFTRYRDGPKETITVRGGSVRLRTADNSVQRSSQYINNTSEKGIIRTEENILKTTENKSFSKQKEVKQSGLKWLWLTMIVSGILILVLVFLQWKFKIFKWFPLVFARFKKYLNNV